MQSPSDILGPNGQLARQLPGFAARTQQQEMAEAVTKALVDHSLLILVKL